MKILVAEDDPVTREAVAACLAGEGFEVLEAADGLAALARWRDSAPDLVCLDIMMPGADGYEVCRRIRAEDAAVPVLFLSAKDEEIDVVVGLELGADDFLRKPFGRHELVARVRNALRRRAGAKDARQRERASFRMGSLTVFPRELRAERSGKGTPGGRSETGKAGETGGTGETGETGEANEPMEPIELTPRETAILALLHERRGEAVSRDELLDRCWGLDYYPESRTLDQHIAKLRRKIEEDPAAPRLVETVRGVGYRCR